MRFCVDYHKLNEITVNDSHPLPLISDLLDSVKDAQLRIDAQTHFSLLDLRSRYWQIPVAPEDRAKTTFVTQNGLYEFTRMPFGLKTAPATFQRAMEVILSGLTFEICLCYLDDVIIFGKNWKEHNDRLITVLTRFRSHNLRVKLAKCVHVCLTAGDLFGSLYQSTRCLIRHYFSYCTNLKQFRSFLGLTG